MKYARTVVCLLGVLLGASLTARANNNGCTGAIWLTPDGSSVSDTFDNLTGQRWYKFVAKANRSYAIMTESFVGIDNGAVTGVDVVEDACAGTPLTVTTTASTEPVSGPGSGGAVRVSLKVAANTDVFFDVAGAVGATIRVRVVETTLFSPRWSTFGGFYTSWGINNTTNASCSVTLDVRTSGGVAVGGSPVTFAVAAGAIVFRDTRPTDLNVAANQAGKVILNHNCPPGGIQADAFMSNENTTPFAVIPVKFEPRTAEH